jgi:hypothetical protein
LQFRQADSFNFSDRTLCSDFLAGKSVTLSLHIVREGRVPTPVMEAEEGELELGEFTVRMVCSLAKRLSSSATS